MERPELVQIFDPANPGTPVSIVPGNFNPEFGHRRWDHRPTAQPADWSAVVREALEIPASIDSADEGGLVDHAQRLAEVEETAASIERFHLRSIEDLAKAGMIAGVSKAVADKLIAWARAHPYLPLGTLVAPAVEAPKALEENSGEGDAPKVDATTSTDGEGKDNEPGEREGDGEPEKHKRPRR